MREDRRGGRMGELKGWKMKEGGRKGKDGTVERVEHERGWEMREDRRGGRMGELKGWKMEDGRWNIH